MAAVVRVALGVPWSKAKNLCKSGRVWVEGAAAYDPAQRLEAGMRVELRPNAPRDRRGVLDRERVLYEDVDVLVVSKPAGVLTLPFRDERDTLVDQVRAYLRRRRGKGKGRRDPMVGVVQRLDKDTTGSLVFARNMKAKRALQEQLRAHTVHRRYLALAHGAVRSGRHESWIIRNRGDGLRGSWGTRAGQLGPPPGDAKRSVTHLQAREALRGATLVQCQLETGRQHQIRIHLSERGHPLLGEPVYRRDFAGPWIRAPRPMLHAAELGFEHPRTGRDVRVRVELPKDFEDALTALRGR